MAALAGFLVIEFDGDIVRTLPLSYGVLRIGRGPDNDLALQHRGVSRNHVELHVTADGILVTDLGSVNGTFIDGERLLAHQPTRLELGHELRVGPFVLAPRRSPSDQPDGVSPTPLEREPRPPRRDIEWVPPPPVERRPSLPVPAPNAQRSRYLNYLPAIFSDNEFLGRYLLVFESIWEPMEQRQDHIEMYLSPATCPASFLPWLASWFDLTVSPHWPERHVRELVQQAMDLYRWRGTNYGLAQMIELWTGVTPHIEESPTEQFVFNVRMAPPGGVKVDRKVVEDLLNAHKPAHAGYQLEIANG
jgi:phage tail-like protein